MKKILCIISVLLCIILTACGEDKSIGIIGGADGPTSIIVGDNTNVIEQEDYPLRYAPKNF